MVHNYIHSLYNIYANLQLMIMFFDGVGYSCYHIISGCDSTVGFRVAGGVRKTLQVKAGIA